MKAWSGVRFCLSHLMFFASPFTKLIDTRKLLATQKLLANRKLLATRKLFASRKLLATRKFLAKSKVSLFSNHKRINLFVSRFSQIPTRIY